MDKIDVNIAWEECIPDLPLDTNNLPPLNALSNGLPNHPDLLDLLNFDSDKNIDSVTTPGKLPSPESLTTSTAPLNLTTDSFTPSPETLSQCTDDSTPPPSLLSPQFIVELPSDNSTVGSRISSPSHTSFEQLPSPQQSAPASPQSTKRSPSKSKQRRQRRSSKKSKESDANSKDSLVLELTTRLTSAGAEATALRKRVASLTQENRSLRAALDHANARLVAVAQAAAAAPPTTQPPIVVGLAQMSQEVAGRISGALTVNDVEEAPKKKRKRVTGAATTMACVMFMWGAFVGTPGLLKAASNVFGGDNSNLPAIWKGNSGAPSAVPAVPAPHMQEGWQPSCMSVLKELPDKSSEDDEETNQHQDGGLAKDEPLVVEEKPTKMDIDVSSAEKMFVDMRDEDAAKVVALADFRGQAQPQYSYVLCRDAQAAIGSIKACSESKKRGEPCGPPHTISLILPAATAGMEDENDTDSMPALAEVQCSIMSVARIPTPSVNNDNSYGRVIATVPQSGTVIHG
ncbi:hypothetical protein BWQ96_02095 [Gracilariopsis chorda]|uniref:Uncharacterized protein n=1 Tax=Gracilariopsis chorda TaxID=448386 RepID=A0A2V3J1F2_9FLOR|nr:hypothetical protein BWQ96_02095 [Gracilariopsis chorda]|eukprot:PXF48143.1 hypothetical protein BWQ96_02095 [Gracilariopsis chorda]